MTAITDRAADEPHMLSFNHYAYGAVVDWIYRNVGGLAPDVTRPGYQLVRFAPHPCTEVTSASTSVRAPLGEVSIDWSVADARFAATVDLPFGTEATFESPVTDASTVTLDGRAVGAVTDLGPGTHLITVTDPHLAQPR